MLIRGELDVAVVPSIDLPAFGSQLIHILPLGRGDLQGFFGKNPAGLAGWHQQGMSRFFEM